jgi:hypothetical protein
MDEKGRVIFITASKFREGTCPVSLGLGENVGLPGERCTKRFWCIRIL